MPDNLNTMATPQVNDTYWFQYSKDLKDSAFKRRDEAAAKLQTLVTWLWGIYTAGAAVGFTLAGKALSFWPKFWIAAASGALILVYWCTVWVQVPKLVTFAPNSVNEIEKAYNNGLITKHHRLLATVAFSVVAAVLVAISLMVASVTKEVKLQPPTMTSAIHNFAGKDFLSITAMLPPKTEAVKVILKPKKSPGPASTERTAVYKPTAEGLVQISIPLESLVSPLEVTLAWTEAAKKIEASMTQVVQEATATGPQKEKKPQY